MTYAKLKASGLEPRARASRFSPDRLLVRAPDFGPAWRLALLALAVTVIVAV